MECFGTILGAFWDMFGTFWGNLGKFWKMFGKFWEHFWDNFGGKIGKLEILFFFELKNISGPKYFLTDVFFKFLYPVANHWNA